MFEEHRCNYCGVDYADAVFTVPVDTNTNADDKDKFYLCFECIPLFAKYINDFWRRSMKLRSEE